MEKLTEKTYFESKKYLSYHAIRNFEKCEYLYEQEKLGNVVPIPRDYYKYGHALDSAITGDFDRKFTIGKDPKKMLEQLHKAKAKAQEARFKYEGKTDKRSQDALSKAIRLLEEIDGKELAIGDELEKESITETLHEHIQQSLRSIKRQKLMDMFPQNKETNQVILTMKLFGIDVKAMLDYFHKENKIIMDYKTTASIKTFNPREYVGQLTWYRMLIRAKYKIDCDCYLVVVDKETAIKHTYFYKFSKELMDEHEGHLMDLVERIKQSNDLGLFEPASYDSMRTCFNCDHYPNCPYTIQNDFEEIA